MKTVMLNDVPKKLGFILNKRVQDLNQIKTNTQLVEFLKGLDRSNFDQEAENYLDEMIEKFEAKPYQFSRNFQQVYNVLLAGQGLKVI